MELKKLFVICGILLKAALHPVIAASETLLPVDTLDDKPSGVAVNLASVPISDLTPGLYQCDDIEQILSFSFSSFGEEDLIIFDMDQTLVVQLRPFYHAHQEKNSPLYERLMLSPPHIIEKFRAYTFSFSPFALMDERIPSLIKRLQEKKVKCIVNTAMLPTLPFAECVDVPSLRVRSLQNLGIDFSEAFPHLSFWDFNTLEVDQIKYRPLFKNGVILSSDVPKHVTTLELLKNLSFAPKRVVFVDDTLEQAQEMYKKLTAKGIETYCFVYSKAHNTTSLDYFRADLAASRLAELEIFLERLLSGENLDEVFLSLCPTRFEIVER